MKIIEQERAPNPRRVKIFVAEKGLDIEFEKIEINKAEHRTPEFTALNPTQRVPVLVLDDGTAISESVSICRYLEALHPEPNLFGKGPLETALVDMWNRRMELGLLYAVSQCFRHRHPAMAEMEKPQISSWADANEPRVFDSLQILDSQLAKTAFVAGDRYTIADITTLVAVDFMKPARLKVPAGLSNIQRWYGEVSSRPSSQAR